MLLLKSTDRFAPNIALSEADFWNEAQAAFLAEAVSEDSDWCKLVDELDCMLGEN